MVVKPWTAEVDMCKEDVNVMTIWVQLQLDLKYWGESCLEKIVKPVGKLLKLDQATKGRDKLMYARVMLEVKTGQEFPGRVHFINERNQNMEAPIHYEWKPTQCEACKMMGHEVNQCTRPLVKQVWRQKVVPVEVEENVTRGESSRQQAKSFN